MADCCAELRSELAALRAEVAKIKPVDEQAIIINQVKFLKRLPLLNWVLTFPLGPTKF